MKQVIILSDGQVMKNAEAHIVEMDNIKVTTSDSVYFFPKEDYRIVEVENIEVIWIDVEVTE